MDTSCVNRRRRRGHGPTGPLILRPARASGYLSSPRHYYHCVVAVHLPLTPSWLHMAPVPNTYVCQRCIAEFTALGTWPTDSRLGRVGSSSPGSSCFQRRGLEITAFGTSNTWSRSIHKDHSGDLDTISFLAMCLRRQSNRDIPRDRC